MTFRAYTRHHSRYRFQSASPMGFKWLYTAVYNQKLCLWNFGL